MDLPAPCEKCAPLNGQWIETEAGLRRCDCARGMMLRSGPDTPKPMPPVISNQAATLYAEMMAGIPFYPPEAGARALIANEIAAMCGSAEEATWLVTQMARRYLKWPGIIEMRALFCRYHQPRDGVQAISAAVDDFFEQEVLDSSRALPAAKQQQLPAGDPDQHSAAESLNNFILDVAKSKDLNRTLAGEKTKVRDVPVVRISNANRITDRDLEREADRYHTDKAKAEIAKGAAE